MSTEGKTSGHSTSTQVDKEKSPWKRALPWLLALLFGVLSLADRNLREVGPYDAARHMLNGALLHDMIRSGSVLHPVEFAKQFYTHYPAISLPYHPPLFPLFEAVFYSLFGVEPAVARMAVAITVAVSALLLYALVLELNSSLPLAFLTTITFFSLRISRDVASDVMLEFPALVLTFGALYCLRGFDRRLSIRTGILFALLAGAAVWTKQTAVGTGAVPWLLVVLTRRWHRFRETPIWLSSAVFGLLTFVSLAISVGALGRTGAGGTTHHTFAGLIEANAIEYSGALAHRFFPAGFIVLAAALLLAGVRVFQRRDGWLADGFYLAWIISAVGVVLVTPQRDERYLLAAYPPMIALGYLALFRAAARILPRQWAWYPALASALLICSYGFAFLPWLSLSGVRPAAQFVATRRPARILYCGDDLEGDFVAQLRATNPPTPPIVVRADQLAPEARTPAAMDEFANQFGIDHVVLEKSVDRVRQDRWAGLPTSNMMLEKVFPVFDRSRQFSELRVYRFADLPPSLPSSLQIQSKLLGRMLDLQIEHK